MEDLGHGLTVAAVAPLPAGRAVDIAVLGGGWAGLAAAVELAQAGATVDVYEASRQLGGRARRVTEDGIALDNGQHILLGAYRDSLAIIRKAGGDPQKLFLRLPLELDFPGEFRLRATRHACPLPCTCWPGFLAPRA